MYHGYFIGEDVAPKEPTAESLGLESVIGQDGKILPKYLFGYTQLSSLQNLASDVSFRSDYSPKDGNPYGEPDVNINPYDETEFSSVSLKIQFDYCGWIQSFLTKFITGGPPSDPYARNNYFRKLKTWADNITWAVRNANHDLNTILKDILNDAGNAFSFIDGAFGKIATLLGDDTFQNSYRVPLKQYASQMQILAQSLTNIYRDASKYTGIVADTIYSFDKTREKISGILYQEMQTTIDTLQRELDDLKQNRGLLDKALNTLAQKAQAAADFANKALTATAKTLKDIADEAQKTISQYKWWIAGGLLAGAFFLWKLR